MLQIKRRRVASHLIKAAVMVSMCRISSVLLCVYTEYQVIPVHMDVRWLFHILFIPVMSEKLQKSKNKYCSARLALYNMAQNVSSAPKLAFKNQRDPIQSTKSRRCVDGIISIFFGIASAFELRPLQFPGS